MAARSSEDRRCRNGAHRLATCWLNVQFYLLFGLVCLVLIPAFTLGVALVRLCCSRRVTLRRLRRAISAFGWVIIHILPFPWVRVRYEEPDGPLGPGPWIFVANHRSLSDPFLMAVLPFEVVQIVNIWPFGIPVLGWVARRAGYLSIREMPPEAFLARGAELLAQGVSLAAFPEGTRSGSRQTGLFHGAVFRLALKTRTPIVPLCVSGNECIPARGSLLLRPGVIRIRRLTPARWEEVHALSAFQLKTRIRERIIGELQRMESHAPDATTTCGAERSAPEAYDESDV